MTKGSEASYITGVLSQNASQYTSLNCMLTCLLIYKLKLHVASTLCLHEYELCTKILTQFLNYVITWYFLLRYIDSLDFYSKFNHWIKKGLFLFTMSKEDANSMYTPWTSSASCMKGTVHAKVWRIRYSIDFYQIIRWWSSTLKFED